MYTPTVWENREVEKPRTFTSKLNPDGTITLTPAEGNVISAGTAIVAITMNKIEKGIKEAHDDLATHSALSATTLQKGHVQLSSSTSSTSTTTAATSSAVKAAYDLANGKQNTLPVENRRKITFGTANPTGGVDGDIYHQYE